MLLLSCIFFRVLLLLIVETTGTSFDVDYNGLEKIAGTEHFFQYNYTVDKLSELSFEISGNIRQLVPLDDDYEVSMILSRADLAGTDPPLYETMMSLQKPVCKFMNTIYRKYFYDELKDVSNFPHFETCPLLPTDYWIRGYTFEGQDYSMVLREGRFKLEWSLIKDDEIVAGCVIKSMVTKMATAE
ncbi:uncharacterized protein LOC131426429 [Malaya genurostris]|uniref:uncharacterized protein LOC131426429 n=1 Tax=Malaya genurostris TaxID=325434 RepID=UPI0026F3FC3F|nr:uncharacterized protein LOC131426429 [Malaya genurostris]